MKIAAGTLLNENVEVLSLIGEGGSASVYHCRDLQLKRDLAVKIMHKFSADAEMPERFKREARLLGQLCHKNIVMVYSFELLDDSTAMICMEYLNGKSLRSILIEKGRLSINECIDIVRQCCSGLQYAHEAGVVHRDLNPSNIFITANAGLSQVKLLDFGFAKLFATTQKKGDSLTSTGDFVGSPPYMSPELIRAYDVDGRADIYALGCVIYECLSGRKAFEADSPLAFMHMHQHDYPDEPCGGSAGIQNESLLKYIALRCLQKDPQKRFQSCAEIVNLLAVEQGQSKSISYEGLDSWKNPLAVKMKTNRPGSILVALSLLALLVLVVLFWGDHLLLAALRSVKAFNSPAMADLEFSLAGFLRDNGKPSFAGDLYEHVLSVSGKGSSCNRLKADSHFELCKLALSANNKEQFCTNLGKLLQELEETEDSPERAALVLKTWALLKSALSSKNTSELLKNQAGLFALILDSRFCNRSQIRRCFSDLLKADRIAESVDLDSLRIRTRACTEFVKRYPSQMSGGETGFLDELGYSCIRVGLNEDASELYKVRLAACGKTGELKESLQFGLADALCFWKPMESWRLLQVMKKRAGPADLIFKARVYSREAQLVPLDKSSYAELLAVCEEGLALLPDEPVISNPKLHLTTRRIEALCLLGRYAEMRASSESLSAELLRFMASTGTNVRIEVGGIGEGFASSEEQIRQYQQDWWYPGLQCFIFTRQYELSAKILSKLIDHIKNDKWSLDEQVSYKIKTEIKNIDPQCSRLISELLSLNKRASVEAK